MRSFVTPRRAPARCLLLALALSLAAQAEDWRYTVRRGDTLIGIARHYLIDEARWRDVQRINRVAEPRRLRPGSVLTIPVAITRVQPAPARIVAVSGGVELVRGGATKPASPGETLQPGDELRCKADSNAALEFADGSRARVLSDTHLQLKDSQRMGADGPVRTQIELKRGRIESSVQRKPGTAPNYLINTPSIQLGVRGTEFRAAAESADVARTEVLTGLVDAANSLGRTDVAAGFGTIAKANQPPEKPRKLLAAADLSALSGQRIERLPVRFDWPAVAGAQRYRVQVARAAVFDQILADEIFSRPEAVLRANLDDGQYLVKVRGVDAVELEGADAVATLHINAHPLPPLMEYPSNKSTVRGDTAQFRWTRSEEAQRYRLQVAASSDFAKPLLDSGALEAATHSVTLTPGEYYWRVASIRAESDQGPFGQINQFAMKPRPAVGGAQAMGVRAFTLEWSEPEPGQQFRFQLARNREFDPIMIEQKLAEPKIELLRPVGGKLFARIAVIEADGTQSAFGPVQHIDVPPHELPITYSLAPRLLQLRWPAVLQPGWKYQWQLARDVAFTDIVHEEVGESSVPSIARPPDGGSFYARVRVIDARGEAGEYAAVTSVEVPTLRPWCCSP